MHVTVHECSLRDEQRKQNALLMEGGSTRVKAELSVCGGGGCYREGPPGDGVFKGRTLRSRERCLLDRSFKL